MPSEAKCAENKNLNHFRPLSGGKEQLLITFACFLGLHFNGLGMKRRNTQSLWAARLLHQRLPKTLLEASLGGFEGTPKKMLSNNFSPPGAPGARQVDFLGLRRPPKRSLGSPWRPTWRRHRLQRPSATPNMENTNTQSLLPLLGGKT